MTKLEIADIVKSVGLLPYLGGKDKVMVFYEGRRGNLVKLCTLYITQTEHMLRTKLQEKLLNM